MPVAPTAPVTSRHAGQHLLGCALLAALATLAAPARAFGPQTHAWIAADVLHDVARDCRVGIAGHRYPLTDEQCRSITGWPAFFLAGAQAPDTYPDPLTARATVHAGVRAGWQSSDWLRQLVRNADEGPALAFALGGLLHGSQDMFANSWINTFAGGAFDAQAADSVAARHIALEKYIDVHVPAGAPSPDSYAVPADFLSRQLLFGDEAVAQYRQAGVAPHIVAMHDVRSAVESLTFALDGMEDVGTEMLADYEADASLSTRNDSGMPLSWQAHARVRQRLDDVTHAQAGNQRQRLHAIEAHTAALAAAAAAERSEGDAVAGIAAMEAELAEATQKLAGMPRTVVREDCHLVKKWINRTKWTTNRVCMPVKSLADGKARADLARHVELLRAQRLVAQRNLADIRAARTLATLRADASARQLEQSVAQESVLAAQRLSADTAYRRSMTALMAQPKPDTEEDIALRRELAGERARMLAALRQALEELHALSFTGQRWQANMDRAARGFIVAGLHVSQHHLQGKGGTLTEYRRWHACFGGSFMSRLPSAVASECTAADYNAETGTRLAHLSQLLATPGLGVLNDIWREMSATQLAGVQRALAQADKALPAFIAPRGALARLGEQEDAPPPTRAAVRVLLAEPGTEGLLTLDNAPDLIDADAGITGNAPWNPERFHAVQYAATFSRLSLLPGRELNRLAGRLAGDRFRRWRLHPESDVRYSLLYDALRSMDGNQQWQPWGLPYARSSGRAQPEEAAARHYGFGAGAGDAEAGGLMLFMNPDARRIVFRQLFPAPLSLLETHPRLQAPAYPFPSCRENPFPVAFDAGGMPADIDPVCAIHELVQQ